MSNIKSYKVTKEKFKLETDIQSVLNNVHSSWFSDGDSLNSNIASYFKSKAILPTQNIL